MKEYKNFFEALEELFAVHLGMPFNRSVDRKMNINNEGEMVEEVEINFEVQPFVTTNKINITINLDQKNNLLDKF